MRYQLTAKFMWVYQREFRILFRMKAERAFNEIAPELTRPAEKTAS
jgi:hypothetical protein